MIKSITVKNYLNESLTIELTRPEKSGFIVKDITGLGPGKADVNISEIVSRDGGSFNSARKATRNIVMNLLFTYDPQLTDVGLYSIEDCRNRSYKYFPLKRQITLSVLTDNNELEIDGYVESNESDIFSKEEGCQISILCPNPYFRKKRNQIIQGSGHEGSFEFPFSNELIPITNNSVYNYYNTVFYNKNSLSWDLDAYLSFTYEPIIINEKEIYNLNYEKDRNKSTTLSLLCEKRLHPSSLSTMIQTNEYEEENILSNENNILMEIKFEDGNVDIKKYSKRSFKININDFCDYINKKEKYYLHFGIKMEGDFIIEDKDKKKFLSDIFNVKISNIKLATKMHISDENVDVVEYEDEILGINQLTYDLHAFYSEEDIYNLTWVTNRSVDLVSYVDSVYDYSYAKMRPTEFIEESSKNLTINLPNDKIDDLLNGRYYPIDEVNDDEYVEIFFQFDSFNESVTTDFLTKNDSKSVFRNFNHNYMERPKKIISLNALYLGVYSNINNEPYQDTEIIYLDQPILELVYEVNGSVNSPLKKEMNRWKNGNIYSLKLTSEVSNRIFSLRKSMSDTYFRLFLLDNFYEGKEDFTGYTNRSIFEPNQYPDPTIHVGLNISYFNFYYHKPRRVPLKNSEVGRPLIDANMPNYQFENSGNIYNFQISEGIEFGYIEKYMFPLSFLYDGTNEIGFIMTIEFDHNLVNDQKEIVGYIVIRNSRYFNEKISINLDDIKNDFEVGQKGDIIIIDTRRGKKNAYYQKKNSEKYNGRINILHSLNKDRKWFEIGPGYNKFEIYHTFYPENTTMTEDEKDRVHADYLDAQIEVEVLYEGV